MTGEKGWPVWVQGQADTLDLFETMKPFVDDDVGKSWGIDPQLPRGGKSLRIFLTVPFCFLMFS